MEIKNAQKKLKEIFKDLVHPRLASFIALTEEVGEVADQIMKLEIYEEISDKKELEGEIADVLVCLFELANVYEIDLENAFLKKLDNLEPRIKKWNKDMGEIMFKKRKKLD